MSRIPVRTAPSSDSQDRASTASTARIKRPSNAQSVLSKSASHTSLRPARVSQEPTHLLSPSVRGTTSSSTTRTVSQPTTAAAQVSRTPIRAVSSSSRPAEPVSLSKGSLALREHIAKARAELTKSARKAPSRAPLPSAWTAETPTRAAMDQNPFESIHDPFNQAQFTPRVVPGLKSAIERAKGSGNLMIAFKELHAIPRQVYDMYKPDPNHVIDFASMDTATWYEAVELRSLNAADNEIAVIENDLANNFEALETLDLHNNRLTRLPGNITKLDHLAVLSLSSNKLDVAVFDIVIQMPNLMVLNLAKNALEGALPNLRAMQGLQDLNLSENAIGTVDDALCDCQSLRTLDLRANKIAAFELSQISRLGKLRLLDLSSNQLRSAILDQNVELPSLEELKLEWNRFTSFAEPGCFLTAPKLKSSMIQANVRS